MPGKETGFRGVSLKAELVADIEELVKESPRYRGVAEFVSEAVRLRMEQIRGNNREVS